MLGYDLGRDWQRFRAVLGLVDSSPEASVTAYEVFADGRLILQKEVRFGEAIPIDVDVRDVLRLTLVVTNTGTDECALSVQGPVGQYVSGRFFFWLVGVLLAVWADVGPRPGSRWSALPDERP
ncbi:MAG: NPCBM/NEW2 domain-containing protein [Egibacteraceae bacterium]